MATINDIAEMVHFSVATVSYVLNGQGDKKRISKKTQDKIIEAARMMNYRPNLTARQLQAADEIPIRLLALWPEFYFEQPLISIMHAVRDSMKGPSGNFEVSINFFIPNHLNEICNTTLWKSYDGIILAGASINDLSYLSQNKPKIPVVLVNRQLSGFPSVSIDHQEAGKLAFDISHRFGGDSICSIWDTRFHVATNLRRSAFIQCSQDAGLDLTLKMHYCEGSSADGYELGLSLIRKNLLEKVIYCNNEGITRGLIIALLESRIRVGEDVLVLTSNSGESAFCRYFSPSISSIELKMQTVFENAFILCLNVIKSQAKEDTTILIHPEVIFRDSLPATEFL